MVQRLLVLSPIEPISRDSGMLIPIWELVHTLGSRAPVDLVTFADAPQPQQHTDWGRVFRVPKRSKWGYYATSAGWRGAKSAGLPRPVYPYAHTAAKSLVRSLLHEEDYSRLLCYLGHVAPLVPTGLAVPRFLVVQDVLHHVMKLNTEYEGSLMRRIASRREVARMREYERRWYSQFDACSVVSNAEARRLEPLLGDRGKIHVIPNGVAIGPDAPDPENSPPLRRRLVYIGALDSPRNSRGVEWLLEEILPLIRREVDVTVDIVGRAPPPGLVKLVRGLKGVQLTGRVENTAYYLNEDAIFVSTNRAGTGIRNGVLEAMASGVPCIATSVSLEGLEGISGQDYIVCDDSETFAWETASLVRSPSSAARLGRAGQELVRARYSWGAYQERVLSMMELP